MIEVAEAKNGSKIHIKDGKFLASSVNPQKEAETWWKNSERLTRNAKTIFILGLGSGFHVEVVKREVPNAKILVIECDNELIRTHVTTSGFEIICEPDWRRLYFHSSVSSTVQDTYAVLVHPASYNAEKEYFAQAQKFLLARSVEGFFNLMKQRPELLAELDEVKIADLARSSDPVTIRTLSSLMKSPTYVNDSRRIWKVLEELIV